MAFETISLGTQPAGTGGDTARTAFEKVNRNFIAADVLASAMSQAQFEANCNANKEIYAASGWVSFGNHESGKQVNECKPGLYTALTTPNTLLIGKAGGVGGSKTDYASVHIDGVVFNLTNQFVLTLPSHPTSVLPERMDMYGVESEKVEISSASPNAYQGGLRGVGAAVNLFTATDQQKKDFFAQNSNTTFIGSDGKIYQYQLYKIAFAGTTGGVPSPAEQGYSLNSFGDLWLKAGKNLLYFGNILRLNDGGYHPSFNPLGAAKFVGDTFWYNTATSITSKADCFNPSKLLTGSGSIASGKSGRPEIGGRYYDVIYADGFGGACRDMRYSANEVTYYDYDDADLNVKNGSYRGFERVLFTKVLQLSVVAKGSYIGGSYVTFSGNLDLTSIADKRYSLFYNATKGVLGFIPVVGVNAIYLSTSDIVKQLPNAEDSSSGLSIDQYSGSDVGDTIYLFAGKEKNYLVGGNYLRTDVAARPENILATTSLSEGWVGGFAGFSVAGSSVPVYATRKIISQGQVFISYNNSASWSMSASQGVSPQNVLTNTDYGYEIRVCNYQVLSYQTDAAINRKIYGSIDGVGDIFSSSDSEIGLGALLGESLLSKVLKSSWQYGGISSSQVKLISAFINPVFKRLDAGAPYSPTHQPIALSQPANSSYAFKAINYNVNINQQAFIQYAYTQLKHNGTNWGDDGKVTIVNNQATKTDLNGNTVLVGTAKLKEPIGWIKNKV